MFRDNVKAHDLQADGSWRRRRPEPGEESYRAQTEIYRESAEERQLAGQAGGVKLEPIRMPGKAAG